MSTSTPGTRDGVRPHAAPQHGAERAKVKTRPTTGPVPSVGHSAPGSLGGHHPLDPRAVRRGSRPDGPSGSGSSKDALTPFRGIA
jgi:hypothetical protein